MLFNQSENAQWFEFELLAGLPNVTHGVLCYETTPKMHPKIPETVIYAKQVHGSTCCKATPNLECDALSTEDAEVALVIKHADCQAAILYDPVNHVVCAVHSGWRGSKANIYKNAVNHMINEYGSRSADLFLCVGPSLGPKSAEFINYQSELPESFWRFQVRPNYFDFWAITEWQALECGLKQKNIEFAKIDTFTDTRFTSYRRTKSSERNYTFVGLR